MRPTDGASADANDDVEDAPPSTSCNTNDDCAAPNTVCSGSTHTCMSLTSADCPDVLGDYKSADAVYFGAILPTVIAHPPEYLSALSKTGESMRAALALAVADFASDKNPNKGLPPPPGKSNGRPIVFVVCSDNASASSTAAATTHLVSDVGVPVIVGTAFSTYSRTIASTLASLQRTDVLLMVPRSSDLAPADNGGHFTRLAPTDDVQGAALSALLADREASIRAGLDAGAAPIRVALVHKEDTYGNGVADAVKSTIRFNGTDAAGNGANFRELKYGNPDTADYNPQFASVTLGIVNAKPHVIILVGTNEIVTSILPSVEGNWSEPAFRPRYFVSDGLAVRELWDFLASNDPSDSIRKRILGTITTGAPARFQAFASAFGAANPQLDAIVSGAAAMYDATYMIAYGAAAIGDKAITGPNLQDGFGLLAPGGGALVVPVGPDAISSTFATLVSGQPVNLDGASSALDLNAGTRAVIGTPTQVWCVPSAGGHAQQAILSGQSVDATNAVQGTVSTACGQ